MKITKIKQTKQQRYALFGDHEFLFSVDAETLAKHQVVEGSFLDETELDLLKQQSDTRKAKDQALRYLSLRAYAQQELYSKLCLKYDEPTAAAAVATMQQLDLLDDAQFALEKAKGMAERGKSSMEIRRKLASYGIQQNWIEQALKQADLDDMANALDLLNKKYIDKLRKGQRQSVMAALARRGFSHDVIKTAVEQLQNQLGEEFECDWQSYR